MCSLTSEFTERLLTDCALFSFFSYQVSPYTVHLYFTPVRLYYHVAKYFYGVNYQPFAQIKTGLHPVALSYKKLYDVLRVFVEYPLSALMTVLATSIILILRHLCHSSISQRFSSNTLFDCSGLFLFKSV